MAGQDRKRLRAVREATESIRTEHLACRDYGHAWQPFTAAWSASERAYYVQLRCGRCGTLRARLIDRRGGQVSNGYVYPEGYLVKGLGRLTGHDRDSVRLASVQRLLSDGAIAHGESA